MAVHGITPPKFAPDANWKDFKEEFGIYLVASGQEKADDVQKISLLVYQMGKQYVKVFKNELPFENENERKTLKTVLQKFDAYFEPKKLLKAHITKFQARKQLPNETITEYITALRDLAKLCEFKDQEDNMLSVQISNGVSNQALRKKLWEDDLTLNQILEKCQTFELRESSAKLYAEAEQKTKDVNAVHFSRGRGSSRFRGNRARSRAPNRGSTRKTESTATAASEQHSSQSASRGRGRIASTRGRQQHSASDCGRCGRSHHPRRCPAYYKTCRSCGTQGHFDYMCRNRSVNTVSHDEYVHDASVPEYEYEFVTNDFNALNIYAMSNNDAKSVNSVNAHDKWPVLLRTPYENGRGAVSMKIDTQAQCNVLSEKSYRRMSEHANIALNESNSVIRAFGNSCVKPIGKTCFEVVNNDKMYQLECEVVSSDVPNILGAKDSEALGFIKRVMSADPQANDQNFVQRIKNVKSVPKPVLEVLKEFPDRFPIDGVGKIPGEVSLTLDPDYKDGPKSFPSRPVPAALKELTKKQLDYLEDKGIIAKVPGGMPTPWCSQLHVVHKKDGKNVRICIDPKFLNRALLREYHPLRTLEDVLTRTNGSTIFSTLDANMGYFQLQLDAESQLLTAFATPWGRYMYRRLPMGISSSPEIFQRAMETILEGMDQVEVIFDDVLLHSASIEQHCKVLRQTLLKARENNLTFRLSKCNFAVPEVEYTGHILTGNGVKPSPEKVRAIVEMPQPKSCEDVRTFLGMATYLSKYIPNFSDLTEPLRQTIKKRNDKSGKFEPFFFGKEQIEAFKTLKAKLTNAPVMRYYSLDESITLSCDASQVGLGAVILQNSQPVAYASKSLTSTEQAYAQIEKELFAIVFGCRKFHHLLYGRKFKVETDHLPLLRILDKPLGQVPMRLQKMLLQLQSYSFTLVGKSGKEVPVADALSRAPINAHYSDLVELRNYNVCAVEHTSMSVFSEKKAEQLRKMTESDPVYQELSHVIVQGWPNERSQVQDTVKPFWDFKDELSVYDGIVFRGERVMIPKGMQREILDILHSSHQGIIKTKQMARDLLYWVGMHKQIEEVISKCATCQSHRVSQQKESLISLPVPDLPWEIVSSDLFEFEGTMFELTVDHYSGYFEVNELGNDATANHVIKKLKETFARHGVPRVLFSDNGPQYSCFAFKEFASQWGFTHQTVSARYPQANGMVEKHVQIVKNLFEKALCDKQDPLLALLEWRNSPRDPVLGSPVQRCMNRRTRTRLPVSNALLMPKVIPPEQVKSRLLYYRQKSKEHYDKNAKDLPTIQPTDNIRMRDGSKWIPARFVSQQPTPRSYKVETPNGRTVTRNRRQLLVTNEKDSFNRAQTQYDLENCDSNFEDNVTAPVEQPVVLNQPVVQNSVNQPVVRNTQPGELVSGVKTPVVTRSGRASKAPARFKDFVKP
jgi:hypothetical protein